ncbi:sensor histidine kinase [Luteibaculum oceani]|uniref:histidine kinase n=1 Tax=Luteibaculum oceani TaxID=1294296 RepID=A0A5C6V8T6_9FLAO|nr:HAMP domain-containing sensor histidine kinase [Luteibaculum oceani]TXC81499.1 HAMP domain-containing histidine kinase [Luteibaculum oceani]
MLTPSKHVDYTIKIGFQNFEVDAIALNLLPDFSKPVQNLVKRSFEKDEGQFLILIDEKKILLNNALAEDLLPNQKQQSTEDVINYLNTHLPFGLTNFILESLKTGKSIRSDLKGNSNHIHFELSIQQVIPQKVILGRLIGKSLEIEPNFFNLHFNISLISEVILDRKGRLIHLNEKADSLLISPNIERDNIKCIELIHPEDRPKFCENFSALVQNKVRAAQFVAKIISETRDAIQPSLFILEPLSPFDQLYSCHIVDISYLKKTEDLLLNENQKHYDTIAALELKNRQLVDFNNIISHNLRTPAGNIQMLCNLLRIAENKEEQEQWLSGIERASNNLLETLDNLLDFIKLAAVGKGGFKRIDVTNIFNACLEKVSAQIDEIKPIITADFEAASTICYPHVYLESIFDNFLSNSFKYRQLDKPLCISVKLELTHGAPVLVYADNGSGIDLEKNGDKLFKLNATFTNHPEAKGFGLFMIKRQVESVGGTIACESARNKGCKFVVKLHP